jgi:hypothetical protein
MSGSNLSLIYSALAASVPSSSSGGSSSTSAGAKNFYIDVDAEIEEYRKLVGRIDAMERDDIEAAFVREVPSQIITLSSIYPSNPHSPGSSSEASELPLSVETKIRNMRVLYEKETQLAATLQNDLDKQLRSRKIKQRESDLFKAEAYKMKDKIVVNKLRIKELEASCRAVLLDCKTAELAKSDLVNQVCVCGEAWYCGEGVEVWWRCGGVGGLCWDWVCCCWWCWWCCCYWAGVAAQVRTAEVTNRTNSALGDVVWRSGGVGGWWLGLLVVLFLLGWRCCSGEDRRRDRSDQFNTR